jgi:hypothetical protein
MMNKTHALYYFKMASVLLNCVSDLFEKFTICGLWLEEMFLLS